MLYSCNNIVHLIYIRSALSQDIDIKVINLVYKMLSAKQLKFAQLLRDALIAKVRVVHSSSIVTIAGCFSVHKVVYVAILNQSVKGRHAPGFLIFL